MADADIIKRVKQIIESDSERRFIVVSAPGKRYQDDEKITDLLLLCHDELINTGNCQKSFSVVRSRFLDIVKELNLDICFDSILDKTLAAIEREGSKEFTSSRGEYLCGIIVAKYLGIPFIDAEKIIYFNEDGDLNAEKTYRAVAFALKGAARAVIPGFYGVDDSGKIRTFSRGGSDVTGAVVARAIDAALYENWTDVSGFLACDPKIVDNPAVIDELSYKELRELSYMGANVLHSECIFPVRKADIPIQIKNAFRPFDKGTTIVPTPRYIPNGQAVTGIAGKRDFTVIYVEKSLMNAEIGFARKVLSVAEAENIFVERVSTGVDTMSLFIESKLLSEHKLDKIIKGIKREVKPDSITFFEDIALIAVVGHGVSLSETCARLFKAVSAAKISTKTVDTANRFNIILGIKNEYYERCIKSIYYEFFK